MSPPTADVIAALARCRGTRVLVVGDVMLDAYVMGTVERLSPEAPVPVVDVGREWHVLGGAANVAHQVRALSGEAVLVGVVGDDEAALSLHGLCEDAGIPVKRLVRVAGRPTTRKVRVLADRQQIVRLDHEVTHDIGPDAEAEVIAAVRGASRPDVVVVSDYGKGVLTDAVLAAVTDAARAWGVPLLVDPKRRDLSVHAGADVLKLNRPEFEAVVGRCGDVAARLPALRDELGVGTLIVTLGEDGMVVADHDGTRHHPTRPSDVADVSGAGDTVIATLALATASGLAVDDAARLANVAASVAVRRLGVSVVHAADLVVEAGAADPDRLVDAAELAGLADAWHSAGRTVVFTNGCFDLFHEGHLGLLRTAAGLGDVLVVALNTDDSVRQLKGSSRPVVPAPERCALVAAVAGVSAVVTFDDSTLPDLIRLVRPHVLVKGGDYTVERVVGHDLVPAWGGRVELIPLVPGRSTSAIVRRISSGEVDVAGEEQRLPEHRD